MMSKGGYFSYLGFKLGSNQFPNGIEWATRAQINRWFNGGHGRQGYTNNGLCPDEPPPGSYHATTIINGTVFYI
jgi:hypothetical protein